MTQRRGIERTREEEFNRALGTALCSVVSHWNETEIVRVEKSQSLASGRGKRPDILIHDPLSPPVVVEASFQPKDADRDAIARLNDKTTKHGHTVKTVMAVWVPAEYSQKSQPEITDALVAGATLAYSLHQSLPDGSTRRFPSTGFIEGTVGDIATFLLSAALPKEDIETVASTVAERINQAAAILEEHLGAAHVQQIMAAAYQRSPVSRIRTTCILWLNALLTQQRLCEQSVHGVTGVPAADENNLPKPSQILTAWKSILTTNWRAIYAPAVDCSARQFRNPARGRLLPCCV